MGLVPMELSEIRIDETQPQQMIVLKEIGGERLLPIIIGSCEANAIQIKISGIEIGRPLTHDLLANLIDAFEARLDRIIINDLMDGTFFARLILRSQKDDSIVGDIDARPSDAIALTVRVGADVYAEESVLSKAAL